MTLVYSKPAISRLVQKNLVMAALGGSLLAGSWWAESYALRGEIKPVLPPYSLGCTTPEHGHEDVVVPQENCPASNTTENDQPH